MYPRLASRSYLCLPSVRIIDKCHYVRPQTNVSKTTVELKLANPGILASSTIGTQNPCMARDLHYMAQTIAPFWPGLQTAAH